MPVTIETPAFLPGTQADRLQQVQTYLFKMAQNLQWAFDNISSAQDNARTIIRESGTGEGGIGQQQSPTEIFASIKSLIIKSADIINAYSVEISEKLSGDYVAKSDFGEYKEATSNTIRKTDKNVEQLLTSVQTISGTVDGLYDKVLETSAYIKTGYLGDGADGLPIYGVEVGQKSDLEGQSVFDKFARFTAGRLSFFDQNDTEVAYVSDYKFYVTNAEVTGALRLSNTFKIYYNGGLAFQWIGGEAE